MEAQIAEYIKTIFWINFWTVIVVSLGFSLLMVCLLIINGFMAINDWLFRSIETKIDPPQKPLLIEEDEEEDEKQNQLATRTTVKDFYLKNGKATISVVREWYNNPDMFSDLNPEMEKLFGQFTELWDTVWPTINAKMEKIKNTGINKGVFELATQLLREDPVTKPLVDRLYSVSDQIEAKINGGN